MGSSAPQRNACSLREVLVGLDRVQQHKAAIQWARDNNRVIDMFGDFSRERHLILFQSGNECENWLDPFNNVLYKMNTLTHVGENLIRLLDRIDVYNALFPLLALRLVGLQVMSDTLVFPVFSQTFISGARMATPDEIAGYMAQKGFQYTGEDGKFTNGEILVWDLKPKNVMVTPTGEIAVIDAEIN